MKPILEDGETLDWYAAEPKDFFDGTGSYTFEVKAAYRLVLDLIYSSPRCQLPDKSPDIAKRLGTTTNGWNKARAQLVHDGKLQVVDGHLVNRRASAYWRENMPKIAENRAKIAEKRSKKQPEKTPEKQGKKNEAPAQQGLSLDETGQKAPYARARESESESERYKTGPAAGPSMSEIVELSRLIGEALEQKPGPYWEGDLRAILIKNPDMVGDDMVQAAKAHHANRGDPVRRMAFLENLAKRKAQDRTWKTRDHTPQEPAPAPAPKHSSKAWGEALQHLLRSGSWIASEYGIVPTRPGHSVPLDLYRGWKELWDLQGGHPLFEYDRSGNRQDYPAKEPSPVSRALWEPEE